MLGVRWLGWWTGRHRHQRDLGYQHLGEGSWGGRGELWWMKGAGNVGDGGDGEWGNEGFFFLRTKVKLNQVSWWFYMMYPEKMPVKDWTLFVHFFFGISWFKLESGAQAWRTRCAYCFFFGGLKLYTLDFLGKTRGDSCGSCWGWVVSFEDFPSHPRQAVEKVFGPDNLFGSQSLKNSFSTKRKHAFSG